MFTNASSPDSQELSYYDLIRFWIDMGANEALFYELDNCFYYLKLNYKNMVLYSNIKLCSPQAEDFENKYQIFCNKFIRPKVFTLETHDMCNNTTWIGGSSNSLYSMHANEDCLVKIKHFLIKADRQTELPQGESLKCILWQSLNGASCPTFSGTPTPYGDTQDGWTLKPHDGIQEVEVWEHQTQGEKDYKVTAFTYNSVRKMRNKSLDKLHGDLLEAFFPYEDHEIYKVLRHSRGERLEFYTTNNVQLTNPRTEPLTIAVQFACLPDILDPLPEE